MATEPEANGSDARPGPLTPAARRESPVPAQPSPGPDSAWNLGDELEGLEGAAEHVDVYAHAPPKTRPRRGPTLPVPRRDLRAPGPAAAVVSISLVTLAVLLQLASVLTSGSGAPATSPRRRRGRSWRRVAGSSSRATARPPGASWCSRRGGAARAGTQQPRDAPTMRAASSSRAAWRAHRAPMSVRVRAAGGGASPPAAVTVRPLRLASVGDINLGDVPGAAIEAEGAGLPVGERRPCAAARRHRLREPRERRVRTRHALPQAVQLPRHSRRAGRPPAPLRDRRAEPGQQPRRGLRPHRHARHRAGSGAAWDPGGRRRRGAETRAAAPGAGAARAPGRLRRVLEHPPAGVRGRARTAGYRVGHPGDGWRRSACRAPARRRRGGHLPLGDREDAVRDGRAGRAREGRRRRRRPARDRRPPARAPAAPPRGRRAWWPTRSGTSSSAPTRATPPRPGSS